MNILSLVGTKICLANHQTMWSSRTIFIELCRRASNCPAVERMEHPGAPAYSVGSYRCTSSAVSFSECEFTRNVVFNANYSVETNNARTIFRHNSINEYKYANYLEFNQNLCVKCKEKQMDWSGHCSLTGGCKITRASHAVNAKSPVDGQVGFLTPGVARGQNLMIARNFRAYSGAFAVDNSKNGGANNVIKEESHKEEEMEEEWIHPENRSDMILDKDPELKSLLCELASDFGKDKSLDDPFEGRSTDDSDQAENETEGIMKGDVKMQTFDFEAGEAEAFEPITTEKAEKKFVFSIDDLVSILREENAQDTCVINIPKEKQYVDYFVVVTGRSPRHLKAMALHVNQQYKSKKTKKNPFVIVEGEDTDDWICIDFGNIVLHLMSEETREFYELEKLWTLGPEYDDQLKRLKDHEVKMKETLDSVDLNKERIEEQEESGDGKPVISFAR